jgi:hypothetical protein
VGTFTAAAAEAGDSEEPEGAAGNACANVGGTGGAEEEAETAAGDACANVGGTGGAEEAETAAGDVCANVGGTGGTEEAAERAGGWQRLVRWLARGPSIVILVVRRLVGPQCFSLRLRTVGGSHLDEELVFSIDGGKQHRYKHRRRAGDDLIVHKV